MVEKDTKMVDGRKELTRMFLCNITCDIRVAGMKC